MMHPLQTRRVRILALIAALPWSVSTPAAHPAADATTGIMSAAISAGDRTTTVTAILADRKPIAKGERFGIDDGAPAVVLCASQAAAKRVSARTGTAISISSTTNHPSCAFLCRFLI